MSTDIDKAWEQIPEDFRQAWAWSKALWPNDVSAGSLGVGFAWSKVLSAYSGAELRQTLERLATTHQKLPPLAVVHQACREARDRPGRYLTPPAPAVAKTRTPAEMEQVADAIRKQSRSELRMFAANYGLDEVTLAKRMEEIDDVGPFERRALRVLSGDVAPGEGLDDLLPPAPPRQGPEALSALIGQPEPDTRQLPDQPDPIPAQVAEILDLAAKGQPVDTSQYSPDAVTAARKQWASEYGRPQSAQAS